MEGVGKQGFKKTKEAAPLADIWVCIALLSNDGVHVRLPEHEVHDHPSFPTKVNQPMIEFPLQDLSHDETGSCRVVVVHLTRCSLYHE